MQVVNDVLKAFKTEVSTVGKKDQAECFQKVCNGKEYEIMASVPPEELLLYEIQSKRPDVPM